ncbi:nitrogen regulation protein NR(II) [Granulosicoccus antarcticus]|uniref:nitrogen regulation protein NR(II) n=1 Tax=Granulosicoccus antarcticus TaxID=437505 RepID=UPI001F2E5E65|nr:nitrogen regulation protein NR(II) [Granulosicoccus antarcticus]
MTIYPVPSTATEINLLDSLASAVIAIDDAMRIRYLNSSAEQLLGVSARRVTNQRLTRALTIPDSLFARIRDALLSGQPFTDRQVSVEPHGRDPQVVDLSLSPYRLNEKRVGLIIEINTVDRPLRIARDEAMKAQQEHARSLLRGLAHEIKNPLGGLRGAAQLLDRQLPDPELSEYTKIIIREADRLQGLIDRMLGPTTRPRRDVVNLHEVLEHVRKIVIAGAPEGVQVRFDYDPSIPECLTDRDRLVQVILNIAGNALQAIDAAGKIVFRSRIISNFTIGGTRHALVACIQIIDNGHGVPEALIDQIFFPMVTGTDHGTGLGLSIAQSTMNQLGGLIECTSEPGNTIFTVLIPMEIA